MTGAHTRVKLRRMTVTRIGNERLPVGKRKQVLQCSGAAAAAALAAVLVAGCSPGQGPGVAANIDGHVISTSDVDEGMQLAPFYSEQPPPSAILSNLIHAEVAIPIASDNGLGVSDQDAAEFLDEMDAESIQTGGEYSQPVLDLVRFSMMVEQAQAAPQGEDLMSELDAQLGSADINVSPRYGSWDAEGASLQEESQPWLEDSEPMDDNPIQQ